MTVARLSGRIDRRARLSLAGLELALDRGRDPLVVRGDARCEAGDDLAVAGDEELLEVPEHLGVFGRGHPVALEAVAEGRLVALGPGQRAGQLGVQRVLVLTG